jgi:hypothetical protein
MRFCNCKNWDKIFREGNFKTENARVKLKNFKKRRAAASAEPKAQREKKTLAVQLLYFYKRTLSLAERQRINLYIQYVS